MPQVYAIVHSEEGRFLMFQKNTHGAFFSRAPVDAPVRLNGAGGPAFPGGRLERKEDVEQGARREFLEETAVSLDTYGASVRTGQPDWRFKAAFFRVSNEELGQLAENINQNLELARQVALEWLRMNP
ncbi:hypothetical protein CYFUS_002682 [Cystobacter fuscus]|uniref:Nudix hydrolase domain-containing protein n=1 Tax=Cystobacter fuscus TaxID=43 RepID=A0A250J1J2_9BACT|nr:NUDIX domain-containing protein [Cystobacter fuscus]ATB37261.1 hypothetical protein CYFUS_002682 [Cystobacter fuscus]